MYTDNELMLMHTTQSSFIRLSIELQFSYIQLRH